MATKNDHSAPLPSAPFRFATLTSTTRWGGGQNKTLTTNRKRKVPNLFQDLTRGEGGSQGAGFREGSFDGFQFRTGVSASK